MQGPCNYETKINVNTALYVTETRTTPNDIDCLKVHVADGDKRD